MKRSPSFTFAGTTSGPVSEGKFSAWNSLLGGNREDFNPAKPTDDWDANQNVGVLSPRP